MRYKDRYGYLLAVTVSAAAILCTAAILMMLPLREETDERQMPVVSSQGTNANEAAKAPANEEKYIMKLYQGKLAVFDATNPDVPQYITDIDERTLRDTDRKAFEEGMPVYSDEELASLLEDYGS